MTFAPSTADLLRRLENLLRPGTIAAVDHAAARVRVQSGTLHTDWLPWFERRAGNLRTWCPPSVGEQCLLLCPGGELASGMVLVGLASEDHPAPADSANLHRTQYPDGAVIDYDHAAHALTATLPAGGTAVLNAPGSVTLNTPSTIITGECDIQGPVRVATDVLAGGISLINHRHGGISIGPDNTGAPE